jgi:hypothetical protein
MKLNNRYAFLFALALSLHASSHAQECISGRWAIEFEGSCNYATIFEAYTHQVFKVITGSEACGAAASPQDDLYAKLALANITIETSCQEIYDDTKAKMVPFTDGAKKGDDLHFESIR